MTDADLHNLMKAIKRGDVEALTAHIKSGVDINGYNDQGLTPLCVAAGKGNTQVLKVLIAAGADVNRASKSGFAPLSFATHGRQMKAAAILRSVGAKHEEQHPFGTYLKRVWPDLDIEFDPYEKE